MAAPHTVLVKTSQSAPESTAARATSAMSSAFGESLAPNGISTASERLHHACGGTRVEGKHPAILEVGAGEIHLDGDYTGFCQSLATTAYSSGDRPTADPHRHPELIEVATVFAAHASIPGF